MPSKDQTQMPNTSLYKYTISLKIIIENDILEIQNYNIRTIVIDSDYDNNNMPLIFITAAMDRKIIDKMIENQDKGKVIMELKRCKINSDMPSIYEDYIINDFAYFIHADINKNDENDFKGENEGREDLFKVITFGLMCIDHLNKNNKIVNGVIKGKLSSLMYYLVGDMPVLMEPPKDNIILKNVFLPPIYSISKALEYLNSIHTFYDTPYRFFIDFDCTYLMSTSGKKLPKKGEDISDVMITLKNVQDERSVIQGMETKDGMYKIDISGIDCALSDYFNTSKSHVKIEAVNLHGDKEKKELSENVAGKVIEKKSRAIRLLNENSGVLTNMKSHIDNTSVQLMVQKTDLDSAIFSPNKEYTIKADEVYNSDYYNGRYLLIRKRELYIREDDDFIEGIMLLFKKIQD